MAASTIHPSAFPSQSGHTNVAVYARVSTHKGQDPSMQTRELEEYCQRRGWTASQLAERQAHGLFGNRRRSAVGRSRNHHHCSRPLES